MTGGLGGPMRRRGTLLSVGLTILLLVIACFEFQTTLRNSHVPPTPTDPPASVDPSTPPRRVRHVPGPGVSGAAAVALTAIACMQAQADTTLTRAQAATLLPIVRYLGGPGHANLNSMGGMLVHAAQRALSARQLARGTDHSAPWPPSLAGFEDRPRRLIETLRTRAGVGRRLPDMGADPGSRAMMDPQEVVDAIARLEAMPDLALSPDQAAHVVPALQQFAEAVAAQGDAWDAFVHVLTPRQLKVVAGVAGQAFVAASSPSAAEVCAQLARLSGRSLP